MEEAKAKVKDYQETVGKVEKEIKRLTGLARYQDSNVDIEGAREELRKLAAVNLDQATFIEKYEVISKLGIKVYPSEDLKTMKIRCSLNFDSGDQLSGKCAIIQFGSTGSP